MPHLKGPGTAACASHEKIPRVVVVFSCTGDADDLRALGAEVMEVDFPVLSHYEQGRPSAAALSERGLPATFDDAPGLDYLLQGLEDARRVDFEEWLEAFRL